MKCKVVQQWMTDFATEGIDPRREAEFRAHLAVCPRCAQDWSDIEEAEAALATFSVPLRDDAFFNAMTARIMEATESVPAPALSPWRLTWGRRWVAVGAAASLLLAIGLVRQLGGPGAPAPSTRSAGESQRLAQAPSPAPSVPSAVPAAPPAVTAAPLAKPAVPRAPTVAPPAPTPEAPAPVRVASSSYRRLAGRHAEEAAPATKALAALKPAPTADLDATPRTELATLPDRGNTGRSPFDPLPDRAAGFSMTDGLRGGHEPALPALLSDTAPAVCDATVERYAYLAAEEPTQDAPASGKMNPSDTAATPRLGIELAVIVNERQKVAVATPSVATGGALR